MNGNGKCSKCGLEGPLATSNRSRLTGEYLFRSWCVSCEKARKAKWVQDNMPKHLAKSQEYRSANLEQVRETNRRWREKNPEYNTEYRREARKQNPEYYRALVSVRRKRVQQNTPAWADKRDIRKFYEQCPKGHHVDHVVPLHGKLVSGLHVLENLQYLPASENMKKRNHYDSLS